MTQLATTLRPRQVSAEFITNIGPQTKEMDMKKGWIIDLQSFTVEAETEEEAIEEAYEYLKQEGVKIDQILESIDYTELTHPRGRKGQSDQ